MRVRLDSFPVLNTIKLILKVKIIYQVQKGHMYNKLKKSIKTANMIQKLVYVFDK